MILRNDLKLSCILHMLIFYIWSTNEGETNGFFSLFCFLVGYEELSTVGDKEWYFFCLRGRKYKNSIRPNRVTGSGFWKATGIDRPIYSSGERANDCVGLKKSLVYYKGSAGKGTKTDWMMHEFRLPPGTKNSNLTVAKSNQEAVRFLLFHSFFFHYRCYRWLLLRPIVRE